MKKSKQTMVTTCIIMKLCFCLYVCPRSLWTYTASLLMLFRELKKNLWYTLCDVWDLSSWWFTCYLAPERWKLCPVSSIQKLMHSLLVLVSLKCIRIVPFVRCSKDKANLAKKRVVGKGIRILKTVIVLVLIGITLSDCSINTMETVSICLKITHVIPSLG